MLLVLRHAESEWNSPPKRCQGQLDVSLSSTGRAAAAALGQELELPDAAYTSHLSRARETAEILLRAASRRAGRPAPPISTDSRLAEAHCGHWQGLFHLELRESFPVEWKALGEEHPAFTFPGGESLEEVRRRFTEVLEELESRHGNDKALVVAHGGPMRLFLAGRLGWEVVPGGPPHNLEGFRLMGDEVESLILGDRVEN